MEFIGWHGTSEMAFNKIKSEGFLCKPHELHKIGRRGYGSYFWKELSGFADGFKELAFRWAKIHNKNMKACAIKAMIEVDENSYLNLDNDEIKVAVWKLCIKHKVSYIDYERIGKIYESLIEEIGIIFVCEVAIKSPKGMKFPISFIGHPKCLIIRDKIVIGKCEYFKEA